MTRTAQDMLVGCHSGFRIAPFRLVRPKTVEETVILMRQGATLMGGGLDLIERMKDGFRADCVAFLADIEELTQITFDGETLRIGAGLTHRAIAADSRIASAFPDLTRAWKGIGNVRVQAQGTLGGNLMANVPAYEAAAILTACGSTATLMNLAGERFEVPVACAAGSAALLLQINISHPQRIRLTVDRSLREYALLVRADYGDGKVLIALGGMSPKPGVSGDGELPAISGPHAGYLRMVLPGLIARMADA
jgi:aerobic carbon-monoxide dehydrogenase medium subunit